MLAARKKRPTPLRMAHKSENRTYRACNRSKNHESNYKNDYPVDNGPSLAKARKLVLGWIIAAGVGGIGTAPNPRFTCTSSHSCQLRAKQDWQASSTCGHDRLANLVPWCLLLGVDKEHNEACYCDHGENKIGEESEDAEQADYQP